VARGCDLLTSASSTTQILGDLVAFDTTSRNSNRPLLDYVVPYLRTFDIEPGCVETLENDLNSAS
jgi:hypothetical protein